jgi:hypothetical protein
MQNLVECAVGRIQAGRIKMDDVIMTVGAAARKLGKSTWTLRHWDRTQLFVPEYRTNAGYRGYTRKQVEELLKKWRQDARAQR